MVMKANAEEEEEEQAKQQRRIPGAPAAVLTSPLSLEGGLAAEHRPPNLLRCVLSLFRNVRPGTDLTHFQLPPLFNMPKSQLQCYGEMIYCCGEDYLSKCAAGGRSSLDRFISVVAWYISTARPAIFGQAPFNPILGETHHVSRGSLNLLIEQVSHHPPVTALHGTDAENGIELIWCQQPVPKFHGSGVEAVIRGKRQLILRSFGEKYEMDSPSLFIRFLPAGADWSGNVRVRCEESALEADVCFHRGGHSFLGIGGSGRCVKGKIYRSGSLDPVYEIHGQWDRTVSLKDVGSGEIRVLYDAKKAISKLSAPVVKDPEGVRDTESAVVWGEVSRAILSKDWDRAREAKSWVEERERRLRRERMSKGEVWIPKHFTVALAKDKVWDCNPIQQSVPSAPIIVPVCDRDGT